MGIWTKKTTDKFHPNAQIEKIFEFPAKYEQKIKKIIWHSEERISQKASSVASSKHGMTWNVHVSKILARG